MQSYNKLALWGISIASLGLASHASAAMGVTQVPGLPVYFYGIEDQFPTSSTRVLAQTIHGESAPPPIESLFVQVNGVAETVPTVSVTFGGSTYDFGFSGTEGLYVLDDAAAEAVFRATTIASGESDNFSVAVVAPGIVEVNSIGYFAAVPEPSVAFLSIAALAAPILRRRRS